MKLFKRKHNNDNNKEKRYEDYSVFDRLRHLSYSYHDLNNKCRDILQACNLYESVVEEVFKQYEKVNKTCEKYIQSINKVLNENTSYKGLNIKSVQYKKFINDSFYFLYIAQKDYFALSKFVEKYAKKTRFKIEESERY